MKFRTENLLTLFLMVVFAYSVISVWDMPIQAKLFPKTVGLLALILLSWQFFTEMQPQASVRKETGNAADFEFTAEETGAYRKTLECFGWIYGFVLALWAFGFHISIPLMILLYLKRHRQSWTLSLVLTLSFGFLLWGVFDSLLHLPFPPGKVVEWIR